MKSRHKRLLENPSSNARRSPVWLIPAVAIGALIIGAILLLARAGQKPYESEVKGSPRLAVDKEEIDYGNVKLGTTVETVFRVKNVGDQMLSIMGEPTVEVVEGC